MLKAAVAGALVGTAAAKTYFKEDFSSKDWNKKWTVGSEWKPAAETGTWTRSKGEYGVDEGLQTGPVGEARFHSITAPLDTPFVSEGKDLVISFTVKHEQNLQCGGAYIKLAPGGFDAKKFGGDTPYSVMFGPDVCGFTRKTHAIFAYNGTNLESKKTIRMESDRLPHRYTLIVRPDNSYEVQIDGTKAEGGSLFDDWAFLKPKTIKDPEDKKPSDWVDDEMMPDPEDKKPEGYDDIPAKIPDPAAKKPEDWDEEEDGSWEAPQIDNPDYKGPWSPKKVKNPAYKGKWVQKEIANPEFVDDKAVYAVCSASKPCAAVGFELWQVQSGSIFDDIIVTDSTAEAEEFAAATFGKKKDAEKKAHDEAEEAKRKKEEEERKAREAEEAAKKAEEDAKKAADAKDEKDEDEEDL